VHIKTHIDGMIPAVMADEFVEDVFQIVFGNIVEYSKYRDVEIDLYVNTLKNNTSQFVDIRIEDPCQLLSPEENVNLLTNSQGFLDQDGLGLGLSITKYVLDSYQGEVHMHDKQNDTGGNSCALTFRFPVR
jgi:nitrogen fixation/metabolism regulation signal transduction histidine kinase